MILAPRIKAFFTHFVGSALVGILCGAVVFLGWYAWPLAPATGVTQIFLILLVVDVVIGPLITLIVFNPRKERLKFDLGVVLLVQVAALGYGMHTIYIARPVYMVFVIDRFELVYANDLTMDKLAKVSDPAFRSVPGWGIETIAARRPEDPQARQKLLFGALAGGDDLHELPEHYVPFHHARAQAVAKAQDLANLRALNPGANTEVEKMNAAYADRAGYLPLRGKLEDLCVVLDRSTGQVLDIVRLKPWAM